MARDDHELLVNAGFFILGAALGASVALLLAPQTGKKTRKILKDMAEDMRENAVDYAERLKNKVS